jgi:hypothetical protein
VVKPQDLLIEYGESSHRKLQRKLPHRNLGCPSSFEIDTCFKHVDASNMPWYHPNVMHVDTKKLEQLARGPLKQRLRNACAALSNPTFYKDVAARSKIVSSIPENELSGLISDGYLEEASESGIKGWVRVFAVPEFHKGRKRTIQHTVDVNQVVSGRLHEPLPTIPAIYGVLRTSAFGVTYDASAFFSQFRLDECVRDFFGVSVGDRIFRLKRLPMGARMSVELAQAAMTVLAAAARIDGVSITVFIDNVLFAGSRSACLAAALRRGLRQGWMYRETRSVGHTSGIPRSKLKLRFERS